MKKVLKIFLLVFLFIIILISNINYKVYATDDIVKNSPSAIAIEVETGDILYEYNSNEVREPASTTKIMSIKLFLDALDNGILKLNQVLTTSDYASSMGGSQIYLSSGEKMTVNDLLKASIIASANDAVVVLAEAIAGTENNFVNLMNEEAKRLKMTNTNFVNSTGLPDKAHVSSAHDLSIISRELLAKYEDIIIPYTSTYEDYLRKDTNNPFWLVNTNKLIKKGIGIDGLKTGWTSDAGYCLAATKKSNGMRIVTVVMGSKSVDDRSSDTIALMNYCFANYDKQIISPKGSVVQTEENILYKPSIYNIILSQDISRIVKKNSSGGIVSYEIVIDKDKINDNVFEGIGHIKVYIDNKLYQVVDLDLKEKVQKSSFIDLFLNVLKNLL